MNQNLKQRRQLSGGLIMIDQKNRHSVPCKKSYFAAFLGLFSSLILFR